VQKTPTTTALPEVGTLFCAKNTRQLLFGHFEGWFCAKNTHKAHIALPQGWRRA
jgi:hypothetical protein